MNTISVCFPLCLYPPWWLQASRSLLVPPSLPCSGRGGSCRVSIADPAFLQSSSSSLWPWCQARDCSSLGPCAGPRDLTNPMQSPYHLFFNILYNSGLQTSCKLGFHCMFTLFLRISASCSSWMQGQVGSAPTYLPTIFCSLFSFLIPTMNYQKGKLRKKIPFTIAP